MIGLDASADDVQQPTELHAEMGNIVAPPTWAADRITVVIVDDHVMVAESLTTTLNACPDITVVAIAESCATGLDAVATHRPDVLLLDQRLPDGLGTDILAPMFDVHPQLKVLFVTGGDSDEVLARAITGGAAGIIPKGKRASILVAAVRAVANDEAVITPNELRRLMPLLAQGDTGMGADLTAREREVLELLTQGKSTADLAQALVVAPATARNHIQSIMNKLGAHSRLEAVAIAIRENMLQKS